MDEKMNYYDHDLAAQAQAVLSDMGLDLEETVNSFLREIVEKKVVPEQKRKTTAKKGTPKKKVEREISQNHPRVIINPYTGEPFPPEAQKFFNQMTEEESREKLEKALKITNRAEACGCLKGLIWWADDADEPLEEFDEYI